MSFSSFRLDPVQQRLWRGSDEIVLRPKAFAVLCHLLQRPGRWMTKRELLEAGWPSTNVSDVGVKVCIAEIRKALGEPHGASLIQTQRRRGYRFVASVTDLESLAGSRDEEICGTDTFRSPVTIPYADLQRNERRYVALSSDSLTTPVRRPHPTRAHSRK